MICVKTFMFYFSGVLTSPGIGGFGLFYAPSQPSNSSVPYLQLSVFNSLLGSSISTTRTDVTRKRLNMHPLV